MVKIYTRCIVTAYFIPQWTSFLSETDGVRLRSFELYFGVEIDLIGSCIFVQANHLRKNLRKSGQEVQCPRLQIQDAALSVEYRLKTGPNAFQKLSLVIHKLQGDVLVVFKAF
jgi:hypothetical protein